MRLKDISDAGERIPRGTFSGKVSGLIVLEKFLNSAKSVWDLECSRKPTENDYGITKDQDVIDLCESFCSPKQENSPESRADVARELLGQNEESISPTAKDVDITVSVSLHDSLVPPNCLCEVVVLGSQTLMDVRNCYHCLSQHICTDKEFLKNYNKNQIEASYFLIEGTFYLDERSPDSERCYQSIMEWINTHRKNLSPLLQWPSYNARYMGSVSISSLNVRINYPYIFSHKGVCNHTIYFRKVGFYNPNVKEEHRIFPYMSYLPLNVKIKCCGCKQRLPSYITIDDVYAESTSAYWCRECFEMFHLNEDGTPSYEFKTFYILPSIKDFFVFNIPCKTEGLKHNFTRSTKKSGS